MFCFGKGRLYSFIQIPNSEWIFVNTFFYAEHIHMSCTAGQIRLVNGYTNESGRVEVCQDELWGTVCDDGWDSNDATTVCTQLGYNYGSI